MRRLLPTLLVCAGLLPAQDVRPVTSPHTVQVGAQLRARLSVPSVNGQAMLPAADEQHPDTRRIQRALNRTLPGQAVAYATVPFFGGWNPVLVK